MAHGHQQFTDDAGIINEPNPLDPDVLGQPGVPVDPIPFLSQQPTSLADVTADIDPDLLDVGQGAGAGGGAGGGGRQSPEEVTAVQEEGFAADESADDNAVNDPEVIKLRDQFVKEGMKKANLKPLGYGAMLARALTSGLPGVRDLYGEHDRKVRRIEDTAAVDARDVHAFRQRQKSLGSAESLVESGDIGIGDVGPLDLTQIQGLSEEAQAAGEDPTQIPSSDPRLLDPQTLRAAEENRAIEVARAKRAPFDKSQLEQDDIQSQIDLRDAQTYKAFADADRLDTPDAKEIRGRVENKTMDKALTFYSDPTNKGKPVIDAFNGNRAEEAIYNDMTQNPEARKRLSDIKDAELALALRTGKFRAVHSALVDMSGLYQRLKAAGASDAELKPILKRMTETAKFVPIETKGILEDTFDQFGLGDFYRNNLKFETKSFGVEEPAGSTVDNLEKTLTPKIDRLRGTGPAGLPDPRGVPDGAKWENDKGVVTHIIAGGKWRKIK